LDARVCERARALLQKQPLEEGRQGGLRNKGISLQEPGAHARCIRHLSRRVQEHQGRCHPLEERASDLDFIPRESRVGRRSCRFGVQASNEIARDDTGSCGAIGPDLVGGCREADPFSQ